VELSASGEVTPQLSLIGSAMFMDAEQLNAANTATFGKTPDNTPEQTASLFAEYRLQSVPGLALSSGAHYVGKRPVNNENQAFVDDYAVLSLGARYATRVAGKLSSPRFRQCSTMRPTMITGAPPVTACWGSARRFR